MIDIVGLGELLIDFVCIKADELNYPILSGKPGGAIGNFLAAAARYGSSCGIISKVGDDSFGHLLKKTMTDAGIAADNVIVDRDFFTTLAFVTLDEHGNREFSFARKPGADIMLRTGEIDEKLIRNCRVFHFGTLSLTDEPARGATKHAISIAKQNGQLISLDPNLRKPLWLSENAAKQAIDFALAQADIIKISDEEIDFMWGLTPEAGAKKLLEEYGASLVYATLGPKGCHVANKRDSVTVDAPKGINAVDTTGAGDIFGGSAMSQLLKIGKRPEQLSREEMFRIAQFACSAASLSTQKQGGISSIPDEQAVLELVGSADRENVK